MSESEIAESRLGVTGKESERLELTRIEMWRTVTLPAHLAARWLRAAQAGPGQPCRAPNGPAHPAAAGPQRYAVVDR